MITAHQLVFGRKYSISSGNYYLNDVLQQSTVNGKVFLVSGPKNNIPAYQFGLGNIVTQLLPISSVWSISFWVKSNLNTLQILLELGTTWDIGDSLLAMISYTNNNKISAGISNLSPLHNYQIAPNNNINDNSWKHIVLILDKTGIDYYTETKIYINGILQTSSLIFGNGTSSGNFISDKLYYGGRSNSYQYPTNGLLSIPKLYNRALNQTEITNLYNE